MNKQIQRHLIQRSNRANPYYIRGIIHPPTNKGDEYNGFHFRECEMETALRTLKNKPVYYEHKTEFGKIGKVTSLEYEKGGALYANILITDGSRLGKHVVEGLLNGDIRSLSIGHEVNKGAFRNGICNFMKTNEVSIVHKPGRPKCDVDVIKTVQDYKEVTILDNRPQNNNNNNNSYYGQSKGNHLQRNVAASYVSQNKSEAIPTVPLLASGSTTTTVLPFLSKNNYYRQTKMTDAAVSGSRIDLTGAPDAAVANPAAPPAAAAAPAVTTNPADIAQLVQNATLAQLEQETAMYEQEAGLNDPLLRHELAKGLALARKQQRELEEKGIIDLHARLSQHEADLGIPKEKLAVFDPDTLRKLCFSANELVEKAERDRAEMEQNNKTMAEELTKVRVEAQKRESALKGENDQLKGTRDALIERIRLNSSTQPTIDVSKRFQTPVSMATQPAVAAPAAVAAPVGVPATTPQLTQPQMGLPSAIASRFGVGAIQQSRMRTAPPMGHSLAQSMPQQQQTVKVVASDGSAFKERAGLNIRMKQQENDDDPFDEWGQVKGGNMGAVVIGNFDDVVKTYASAVQHVKRIKTNQAA